MADVRTLAWPYELDKKHEPTDVLKLLVEEEIFIGGGPKVDVRAYGVDCTGVTDSTAQLAKAVAKVESMNTSFVPSVNGVSSATVGNQPVLFIPANSHIKVKDVTTMAGYAKIFGYNAVIEQTDQTKNIFSFPNGYMVSIKGITFIGGFNHVVYSNANINSSFLTIIDCEFHLSQNFAINTFSTLGAQISGNLLIVNCKAIYNRQFLRDAFDYGKMSNCWLQCTQANYTANTPQIDVVFGHLRIDNLIGVPEMGVVSVNRAVNARWIDIHSNCTVHCVNPRFGGEDAGMGTVWCFTPDLPTVYPFNVGTGVIIEGGQISVGPATDTAAGCIHLRTGVPQLIRIVGCDGMTDNAVIVNSGGLNLDTYFDTVATASSRYRFDLGPNLENYVPIPTQLLPFVNWLDPRKVTSAIPTTGWWQVSQKISNANAVVGAWYDLVCTTAGKAGSGAIFGYANKISPFPIGKIAAVDLGAGQQKVTFTIPAGITAFQAIVTMYTNPNPGADANYRTTRSDFVAFFTDAPAGQKDHILASTAFAPAVVGFTAPSLVSCFFSGGAATQPPTDGGGTTFIMTYGNCGAGAVTFASIELLGCM